ncbi:MULTISPECIES: TolC family protein [Niastella]|uniref:TolC family protein n=1 Tax=Niastella soli TaxID=2821487 RepID=A0ABS3Z242_9BACT|nr:TolC family protein [Niastella soli]MBO9204229.1 TolC family protein [Niastella soli]
MKHNQSLRTLVQRLVLLVAGVSVLSLANAQTAPLSLKEALQQALKNKSEAIKAKLDEENSQNKIEEARSRALPQINGTAGLTYNPILQLSAISGDLAGQPGKTLLIPFGQKWNGSASVNVSQTLFDKSVFTALKASKTTQQYYQLVSGLTDEQIIEKVATQYYQVLVQRQQLVVIDSNIATTTRVMNVIEGQFKNGLAKKIDLDRSKVNLSNLQAQRQQLNNAVQLQENTLKFYMGIPIETAISVPASALDSIEPKLAIMDNAPDVKKMSDYQVLKKQEELLVLQKEATTAGFYPSLSLSGSYGYSGLSKSFPVGSGSNWFDYASVGVNLKVPIFNGFSTRSKVRQADVEIRKLQADIKNTELGLNLAHQNAKTQLGNSIITLNNQKTNVALAEEVYTNSQNNYAQGLAPLTDLLDAENSLTTAQNNYTNALLDYRIAEIQLIKAQGNLKSLLN